MLFRPLTILLSLFWTVPNFSFAISQTRLSIPAKSWLLWGSRQLKFPKGCPTLGLAFFVFPPLNCSNAVHYILAVLPSFPQGCCLTNSCLACICAVWKCRTLYTVYVLLIWHLLLRLFLQFVKIIWISNLSSSELADSISMGLSAVMNKHNLSSLIQVFNRNIEKPYI